MSPGIAKLNGGESPTTFQKFTGGASAALVGGTASAIGGGKFANGAKTAMIQYLYNEVGQMKRGQEDQEDSRLTPEENAAGMHKAANVASLVLALGALTPCSLFCAGLSLTIDSLSAYDHFAHGDSANAILTILPGASGEVVGKSVRVIGTFSEGAQKATGVSVTVGTAAAASHDNHHKRYWDD